MASLTASWNNLRHPNVPLRSYSSRGAFVIAAILGVLKTGRIYVPLDPAVPAARTSVMLQDSQARLVLTNSQNLVHAGQLAQDGQQIINCDDVDTTEMAVGNLDRKILANTPALILYTSGSTG